MVLFPAHSTIDDLSFKVTTISVRQELGKF